MPSVPKSIVVGAYTYSVEVDQTAIDAASREQGTRLSGSADHLRQCIALDPSLGPDALAETLMHECLHAMFQQAGCHGMDNEDVERIVVLAGHQLVEFVRDNPELVAFVMGGDHAIQEPSPDEGHDGQGREVEGDSPSMGTQVRGPWRAEA
jgi:hypothetical protein